MLNQQVNDLFGTWKSEGTMTAIMATTIDQEVDALLEEELARIETLVDVAPGAAFVRLGSLISFVNDGASHRPSIVGRLEKWIPRFRDVLRKLAVELEATSFSVSVGFPPGLSIGLSFPATRRSTKFLR